MFIYIDNRRDFVYKYEHWWGERDSNPYLKDFKSFACCRWATAPYYKIPFFYIVKMVAIYISRATTPTILSPKPFVKL